MTHRIRNINYSVATLISEQENVIYFFHSQDPIPYNFAYAVKDEYAGTDFGQNEESDGQTVKGSYTVQLPDGRKQTVRCESSRAQKSNYKIERENDCHLYATKIQPDCNFL